MCSWVRLKALSHTPNWQFSTDPVSSAQKTGFANGLHTQFHDDKSDTSHDEVHHILLISQKKSSFGNQSLKLVTERKKKFSSKIKKYFSDSPESFKNFSHESLGFDKNADHQDTQNFKKSDDF